MMREVIKEKITPRLRAMNLGCAVLMLVVMLLWPSVGMACTNWTNSVLLRFYFGVGTLAQAIPAPCAVTLPTTSTAQSWSQGVVAYLRGDRHQAEPLLTAAIAAVPSGERTHHLDQLLSFATLVSGDDPMQASFALALAQRYQHNSPLGYMRLAQIYIGQARTGDTTNWAQVRMLTRLAGQTNLAGFAARWRRNEAWFYLGEFSKGSDQAEALAAYQAAIAEDPQGLYSADAAVQIAQIYIQRQQFAAARHMLNFAASLPSQYHGYSQARLLLAQMELQQRGTSVAVAILEETITQEPDYIPTRLYLAALYLDTGQTPAALVQYRAILKLDPTQNEARTALEKLAGQQ